MIKKKAGKHLQNTGRQKSLWIIIFEVFTNCIRKERSYKNSDAWKVLNGYIGNLIIIKAENATVIPDEVINDCYESALNGKTRKIITVKIFPHGVLNYIREHGEYQKNIVDEIIKEYRILDTCNSHPHSSQHKFPHQKDMAYSVFQIHT